MKSVIVFLGIILFQFPVFSQSVLQEKKFTRVTKDNSENNSGAYASVTIDYKVYSVGKTEVYVATSVSDFVINAPQGYGYKGKIYHGEVPGLIEALDAARAHSPTVSFNIYYAGNLITTSTVSVTAVNNLNQFSGDGFSIPATAEQIKNPNWTVEAVALKSFYTTPDESKYTEIIARYLKMQEDNNAYKKQISIADKALSSAGSEAQLIAARAEYDRAAALSPKETYPEQKIETINNRIADLRKKEQEKQAEELKKQQDEKTAQEEAAKKKAEEEKNKEEDKEKKTSEEDKEATVKKEKKPPTEQEQDEMAKRNQMASKYEADGDALVTTDALAAKQNYEQAQLINYTTRVEQKIKNLKMNLQVQAGYQAVKAVDALTDQIDPNGNTRFSVLFSGYDGFAADNGKLNKEYPSKPWQLHFFGLRLSAILLALELRLGYFNSPYYQFEVKNTRNVSQVIDHVGIQQQAITTGFSAGLNIPLKHLCFYGLYGAEWVGFETSKTMQEGKGYSFDEDDYDPKFPNFIFVLSAGIDFHIPKTKIGIGVRYNLNKVQIKPREANVKIKGGADTRYQYFMDKISPDKMEYSNFGARFIWSWK